MHEADRDDSPLCDRTPTQPIPPIVTGRIEITLDDPESAASFLERVAMILRQRGRVSIIVE